MFLKISAHIDYEGIREIWDTDSQNLFDLCRIKDVRKLLKAVNVFLERDDEASAEVALQNLLNRLNSQNILTLDFQDIAEFLKILREKKIYG